MKAPVPLAIVMRPIPPDMANAAKNSTRAARALVEQTTVLTSVSMTGTNASAIRSTGAYAVMTIRSEAERCHEYESQGHDKSYHCLRS